MSARACGRLPALRAFDTRPRPRRRPRGREERPPARSPPGRRDAAEARKFTARPGPSAARGPSSAVPSLAARPRRRAERTPNRRVPCPRSPDPGALRPVGDAPSSTSPARGLRGRRVGGEPPTDREQPPRAYLRRSSDGRRGAPGPRGVGGAGGGPGGCAARRPPTFPPPALPGEPTGRAASAPVRTRRAAFHRGGRRRGGRGAGRGREEAPAGGPAARPPSAVPPGRSCAPPPAAVRGEAEPPGTPWAGVGPLRQEAVCKDRWGTPLLPRGLGGRR